jgi:small subunit ribosomal protein S17e
VARDGSSVRESTWLKTLGSNHGVEGSNPSRPIKGDTMGRVKSIAIKTLGDDLIREHSKKFSPDFESNKKALEDIAEIKSKRVRNVLAGYITKKMRGIKHQGVKEEKQAPMRI